MLLFVSGLVEYFSQIAQKCAPCNRCQQPAGVFKKVVQQDHESFVRARRASPLFDARSVCLVREHGKMATCLGKAATAKAGNGAGDFFQHSLSRLFQFYGKNRQVIVYGISLSPLVDGFHDGIDTVFHRILAGGFND